jgi:hypothetical protein
LLPEQKLNPGKNRVFGEKQPIIVRIFCIFWYKLGRQRFSVYAQVPNSFALVYGKRVGLFAQNLAKLFAKREESSTD